MRNVAVSIVGGNINCQPPGERNWMPVQSPARTTGMIAGICKAVVWQRLRQYPKPASDN